MGTPTSRAGFIKSDYGENQDVDVLNDNWDRADALVGDDYVTSGTRPATPFNGYRIYESDTQREYVRDGSSWKQTSGPLVIQPQASSAWTGITVADALTTETDVPGAVTAAFAQTDATKKYMIGISWYNSVASVVTDAVTLRIRRKTNNGSDTIVGQMILTGNQANRGGGTYFTFDTPPVSVLGSGGTVYRVTLEKTSGTGTHTFLNTGSANEIFMVPLMTEL